MDIERNAGTAETPEARLSKIQNELMQVLNERLIQTPEQANAWLVRFETEYLPALALTERVRDIYASPLGPIWINVARIALTPQIGPWKQQSRDSAPNAGS